jgi:rhodanese-related sulfurtransferase
MDEKIFNLGIIREPNNPVPGVRTGNLLQEIAFDWKGTVDKTVEIGTVESFEKSLELYRNGIMAGPSSGFALAGLLNFLSTLPDDRLDQFRNEDGEVLAVFICPDSPFPYVEEYFEYLDANKFPKIENANLLRQGVPEIKKSKVSSAKEISMSPADAFNGIYGVPVDTAWKLVDSNRQIPLNDDIVVIDVRDLDDFNHVHLSQSIHVDYREPVTQGENLVKKWRGKTAYVICNRGNRSMTACAILAKFDLKTYSIIGGMIEWSSQNLPRWRPEACVAFQRGDQT